VGRCKPELSFCSINCWYKFTFPPNWQLWKWSSHNSVEVCRYKTSLRQEIISASNWNTYCILETVLSSFWRPRFTANQFVLATSPLRHTTRIFILFQLSTWRYSPYELSFLMRGWVCRLQLLLGLTSAIILKSESCVTHSLSTIDYWRSRCKGQISGPPLLHTYILIASFYCLRFETPSNLRAKLLYLEPPWTEWQGYTPRHWIPFSSPPETHRATVELFNPAFTLSFHYIWSTCYDMDRTENTASNISCIV
jgi:hypothetical protein